MLAWPLALGKLITLLTLVTMLAGLRGIGEAARKWKNVLKESITLCKARLSPCTGTVLVPALFLV